MCVQVVQEPGARAKRVVATWVEDIRLAPERLEVEITYRVPEPVVKEAQPVARAD